MRSWGVAWAAAGSVLIAACGRRDPRPHVLVLVVDTLRADALGAYTPGRQTPNLDTLAGEGVLFEEACAQAPRTWQSFVSILTGLYPLHHGVRFIYDHPLAPSVPSLPSLLAREGYATAAFDAIPFLKEMTGARAFASHFDAATYGSWVPDAALLEGVADWMRRPGPPRLAFVRLHGPHWPYVADPEHLAAAGEARFAGLDHRFNQGGYGLADEATPGDGFRLQDPEEYRRRFFDLRYSPRELAHMRVHYDAAVRTADARVGRLLASLREARLLDRTLVVVTSDHGESFGEHGYLQHGPRVDEPVLRVPLIVRFPAQAPHGRPGQRVAGLVRSVDVLPTVLDTLGLEAPKRLDGVSLLPAIDRAADLRLSCYAESDREFIGIDPELALPGVAGKQRALRDARFKILYRHDGRGPVYRLFDLERDPGETGDVSADHPRELERLRTELDALMRGDVSPHDREAMLTAEQTERLRALGYLR